MKEANKRGADGTEGGMKCWHLFRPAYSKTRSLSVRGKHVTLSVHRTATALAGTWSRLCPLREWSGVRASFFPQKKICNLFLHLYFFPLVSMVTWSHLGDWPPVIFPLQAWKLKDEKIISFIRQRKETFASGQHTRSARRLQTRACFLSLFFRSFICMTFIPSYPFFCLLLSSLSLFSVFPTNVYEFLTVRSAAPVRCFTQHFLSATISPVVTSNYNLRTSSCTMSSNRFCEPGNKLILRPLARYVIIQCLYKAPFLDCFLALYWNVHVCVVCLPQLNWPIFMNVGMNDIPLEATPQRKLPASFYEQYQYGSHMSFWGRNSDRKQFNSLCWGYCDRSM